MYKIIDLGSEFESTGEPRVRLLDSALVKTASTEIQDYWDRLTPSDDKSYLWVIGVSAWEYYGCNRNGDAFHEIELKKTHPRFVENAHIFLQHVNRDPAKSIGKPIYSWYNDDMHRVELILAVDKNANGAQPIVDKIANGESIFVSMGTTVKYDVCSICGHKAPNRREYCDHLKYNLKKILPDGRQVCAFNPNPNFFDISIVRKPADPTAFTLDKIASEGNSYYYDDTPYISSAELGERSIGLQEKVAELQKLSDIVKSVDGILVDKKGFDYPDSEKSRFESDLYHKGFLDALKALTTCGGFSSFGNLNPDYSQFDSPAGLLCTLSRCGAPLSFGDIAWMVARKFLSNSPSSSLIGRVLSMLPMAIETAKEYPEELDNASEDLFSTYNGELDSPLQRTLVLRSTRPILRARITIIKRLGDSPLNKIAADFNEPDRYNANYGKDFIDVKKKDLDLDISNSNFSAMHFTDKNGKTFTTTPYELRNSPYNNALSQISGNKLLSILLGLGAAAFAVSNTNALTKAIGMAATAAPAVALWSANTNTDIIRSHEGDEVPVQSVMQAFKKEGSAHIPLMTLGAAVPVGLAADYAYNNYRYGPGQEYNPERSVLERNMLGAGKFVVNHPLVSITGGALGTGLTYHVIRNLFRRKL